MPPFCEPDGLHFPFPNCLNEAENPATVKAECGMSIIVDLYEILVGRGTPKKKVGGAAPGASTHPSAWLSLYPIFVPNQVLIGTGKAILTRRARN